MSRETFTGGTFQTNTYLVKLPQGNVVIDAPGGTIAWAKRLTDRVEMLLLTHSHFDHVEEAAALVEHFTSGCAYHPLVEDMAAEAEYFKAFGLPLNIRHVEATRHLEEGAGQELLGARLDVLHVPGHHPASICFYFPELGEVYTGDTLMAGSIGRTDFAHGNHAQLLDGIATKLLTLPDDTLVHPGHGPSTTIGKERAQNPYLR